MDRFWFWWPVMFSPLTVLIHWSALFRQVYKLCCQVSCQWLAICKCRRGLHVVSLYTQVCSSKKGSKAPQPLRVLLGGIIVHASITACEWNMAPLFPSHPSILLQLLQDVYGPIRVDAEEGYDVSVQFDLENLPDNPGLGWEGIGWSTGIKVVGNVHPHLPQQRLRLCCSFEGFVSH